MTLNKAKTVSIFTYSNRKIGSGHLKRSKILYDFLKKYYICKLYINKNINKKNTKNSDVIILDHHFKKINSSLFQNIFTLALDYYGKSKFDKNFLVIKQKKIFTKNNNINLENLILDKKGLDEKKKIKLNKKSVLISLGSTNKKKMLTKLIYCLRKLKLKITVIKGKYNLEKINKNNNLKIYKNRLDFYSFLKKNEFIITNTATTLFESIYLNKKIISIPQTRFEATLYKKIFKKEFNYSFLKKKLIKISDFKKVKKMKFRGELKIKKILDNV